MSNNLIKGKALAAFAVCLTSLLDFGRASARPFFCL